MYSVGVYRPNLTWQKTASFVLSTFECNSDSTFIHSSLFHSFLLHTDWWPVHLGEFSKLHYFCLRHTSLFTLDSLFRANFLLIYEHLKNTILTIFHIILLIIFLHSNLHSNLCNAIIILLIRIRSLYTLVYYKLTLYMLYWHFYNSLHFTYRNKPTIYIYHVCFPVCFLIRTYL